MPRFIVIPLYDHTTDAEAIEFAKEIDYTFQPSHAPYVAEADALPQGIDLDA